jgi:cytochrome c oxidase assembly factor CtaG
MSGWELDPWIAPLLTLSVTLQLLGLARMGPARARVAPPWRNAAYALAVLVLCIALFSPIDARADDDFAWHMVQHLLLMLVAAPLLAVSNAQFVALHGFPLATRRRVAGAVAAVPGVRAGGRHAGAPWLAAAAFAATTWLWHAPKVYDAALASPPLHAVEHLTFLFSAAVFWRMIATIGDRRLDTASSIVLVTLVGLQGNLMAALLTLAPAPLYAHQGGLERQQLAGLAMWVPAGLLYLAATVRALHRMFAPLAERPRITTL